MRSAALETLGSAPNGNGERRRDMRWAICPRPVIMIGGELTLADLELRYSPQSKFYIALTAGEGQLRHPGHRRLRPPARAAERAAQPLDRAHGERASTTCRCSAARRSRSPSSCLLVFSTNLPPHSLGDEAFFRRIRHKIEVGDPDEKGFLQILEMICEARDIPYPPEGGRYLIEK